MLRINVFLTVLFAVCILFASCDSNDGSSEQITDIHSLEDEIDIKVAGRRLLLDGQPFTVKGVNYSPIPIGASFEFNIGDVFFDYFNPIHELDFPLMKEMGVNTIRIYGMFPWDPQNGPADPNNPVADRDHTKFLDLAFEAGICVFITYPIGTATFRYKIVQEEPTDGSWFAILPTGPPAPDDPEKKPTDQIWVEDEESLQGGFDWLGQQTAAERRESDRVAYLVLAEKYKDHPAVFGWVLTNELNTPANVANPRFWSYLNELAGELKTVAPEKETMVSLFDDGLDAIKEIAQNDIDVSNIDIWGINSYRGNINPAQNNFTDLFSSYKAVSDKPLIVTEFGPPSSTRTEIESSFGIPVTPGTSTGNNCADGTFTLMNSSQQESVADYIEGHWKDIEANSDVAAGGIVFEWVDEWWKHGPGDISVQDQSPGANVDFPGGCWDEEAFGINAIVLKRDNASDFFEFFLPDERIPRAQYDRLKQLWTGN